MDLSPRSRSRIRVRVSPTMGFRRRSGLPTNPLGLLVVLIIGLSTVLIGGFYVLTATTVTVLIDDNRSDARTHQTTVAALLAELQVPLNPQDVISPALDSAIRNKMVVTINRASLLIVDVDGQRHQLYTRMKDPREILNEAKISLGADDLVLVDNEALKAAPYPATPHHIVITRARSVRLDNNGSVQTINTARRTVGEVLSDAHLKLYLADSIEPASGAPIPDNSLITVRSSIPVTILIDGRTLVTRTHGTTVGAVLAETGTALVGLDYVIPDAAIPVKAGMEIRVVRVSEEESIERSPINFKRVLQPDPTLALDQRRVIQEGTVGIQERRVHIRREDGLEVSRSTPQEVITQPTRDEIIAVGTLPTLKTLDTPDGTLHYWRVIKVRAVSYKPASTGKAADDPTYGLTSTGQRLHKGLVAVDPTVIPLGTTLYIPGYGSAVAADIGGGVRGLMIDLGYSDEDYQEWSTTVDVYLLPPAPPPEQVPLLPEGSS
ncbi:MAG: ubiquitin-like domain-containing protein [Chloroflexota bacterium]